MKTKKTSSRNFAGSRTQRGFTLVELMIVVAIVGILALIAVPSYRQFVVKANRAAAESFLLNVANKQEQYILDRRQYAETLGDLRTATPTDVAKNYNVTITGVMNAGVPVAPPAYTITATPTGSQAANDTHCGNVSITQAGVKSASTGATDCW